MPGEMGPCPLVCCFQHRQVLAGVDGGDFLDLAGGPVDGQGPELGPLGKAEEGAVVAVGGVAGAAFHEAKELVVGGLQNDASADGVPVGAAADKADPEPGVAVGAVVAEEGGGLVVVGKAEVVIAVVVEVADGQAAPEMGCVEVGAVAKMD